MVETKLIGNSCDSYNTSQISIIRALPPTSDMVVLPEGGNGESVNTRDLVLPEAVQNFTRGRPEVAAGLIRHSGISSEAFDRVNIQPIQPQRQESRSASAGAVGRETQADLCTNALDSAEIVEINDSETVEEEEDDVDFWGRESPRGKPPVDIQPEGLDDGQFSDNEEEDDEDELMDDELEDDEDDEEDDYMALVGHR